MNEIIRVYKELSRNDTGETNSHQSGISIPKFVARTDIFPQLGIETLNPRTEVIFFDENGKAWTFQYIYYNDAHFGKPAKQSHDEFRLTRVRQYIKENNIKAGDEIWFSLDKNDICHIGFVKNNEPENTEVTTIKLGNGWHYIKM